MLSVKSNPVGIDWYIQQLQNKLHAELITAWGLADATQYECYGRCYRNKKDTGYVAEVFTEGNEYKEVYWNDTLTAISFFGITNGIKRNVGAEADVHLVYFTDLSKLALTDRTGTLITHRADEELRKSVIDVIGKYSFGFSLVSVELWVENVLREYPGSRTTQSSLAIKGDMHPVHCFRINLKLSYNPNKIC